jgi:hypothetical protein
MFRIQAPDAALFGWSLSVETCGKVGKELAGFQHK